MSTVISFRMDDYDVNFLKTYSALNGVSVADFVKRSVIERIEDEYDIKIYKKSLLEHKKNPKTYTLDEIEKGIKI